MSHAHPKQIINASINLNMYLTKHVNNAKQNTFHTWLIAFLYVEILPSKSVKSFMKLRLIFIDSRRARRRGILLTANKICSTLFRPAVLPVSATCVCRSSDSFACGKRLRSNIFSARSSLTTFWSTRINESAIALYPCFIRATTICS